MNRGGSIVPGGCASWTQKFFFWLFLAFFWLAGYVVAMLWLAGWLCCCSEKKQQKMSDDGQAIFADNVSDFGVDAVPDAALAESVDDDDADDDDADDDAAVAEDLHLVEDPATDIFNEADESPQIDLDVEPTERERLTAIWKTKEKPALNKGSATSTTAHGVKQRHDVSAPVGSWTTRALVDSNPRPAGFNPWPRYCHMDRYSAAPMV